MQRGATDCVFDVKYSRCKILALSNNEFDHVDDCADWDNILAGSCQATMAQCLVDYFGSSSERQTGSDFSKLPSFLVCFLLHRHHKMHRAPLDGCRWRVGPAASGDGGGGADDDEKEACH
jgi:hypothetical protein